ncbi:hypothetical protein D9758_000071 [Tetrapyrgos nigripes]|uniref:3'-5' exonuclease domain-containing protein n=1 Tax=Tetrapyrgos nigripes TaxID=182062 RepID=A0A8H5H1F5_9AGAR|nr:hypothetical protein D9758_000071 [Tetrapyrgos nigripes]
MSESIQYCRTHSQAEAVLIANYDGHVGFDLEWKPNYIAGRPQNPVALVQLATDRNVLLIQVARMKHFPRSLKNFLANRSIPKAGVGIQEDVKKLWTDYGVSVTSCIDLSLFARSVDCALFTERLGPYKDVPLVLPTPLDPSPPPVAAPEVSGESSTSSEPAPPKVPPSPHDFRLFRGRYRDPIGLARLVKAYHNKELPKEMKITRSNWEAELNARQISYAAADARAGYTLYEHLLGLFFALPEDKRPKRKYYAFDCIQGELFLPTDPESREPIYDPAPSQPTNTLPPLPDSLPREKWSLHNPEYDTGPMPPKKEKKDKDRAKGKDGRSAAEEGKPENENKEMKSENRRRKRRQPQREGHSQESSAPMKVVTTGHEATVNGANVTSTAITVASTSAPASTFTSYSTQNALGRPNVVGPDPTSAKRRKGGRAVEGVVERPHVYATK